MFVLCSDFYARGTNQPNSEQAEEECKVQPYKGAYNRAFNPKSSSHSQSSQSSDYEGIRIYYFDTFYFISLKTMVHMKYVIPAARPVCIIDLRTRDRKMGRYTKWTPSPSREVKMWCNQSSEKFYFKYLDLYLDIFKLIFR